MNIKLGKTQCSMMNQPNDGTVDDGQTQWRIGRNYQGMIVLRSGLACHPEFAEGMGMSDFVCWINSQLQ